MINIYKKNKKKNKKKTKFIFYGVLFIFIDFQTILYFVLSHNNSLLSL